MLALEFLAIMILEGSIMMAIAFVIAYIITFPIFKIKKIKDKKWEKNYGSNEFSEDEES